MLALMTKRWRLSPMDKSDRTVAFLGADAVGIGCSGDPSRFEYFANWGGDNSYLVMRDKAGGVLVVWYCFTF